MLLKILKRGDKEKVIDYIGKLPDEKRYKVDIKSIREVRSPDQNQLYWLWLTCISDETGNDKDTLHEHFKDVYLGSKERIVFNRSISIRHTTTKLDTKEFAAYLDRIQTFANTELGIVLPNPEDLIWADFYSHYKDYI